MPSGTVIEPPVYTQTSPVVWLPGQQISFSLPAGTFTDPQGEALTYTASCGTDFASLPSWLTFDPATQTFSGVVPVNEPARFSLDLFASNSSGLATGERVLVSTSINPLITADLSPLVTEPAKSHLPNTPVTLTYSFMATAPSTQFYSGENNGFLPLTTAEQALVKQAMSAFSAVANVTFVQVADSTAANIRFGTDTATAYSGYTAFDPTGQTDQTHVMLANNAQEYAPLAFIVLHELANCLHLADYSGAPQSFISAMGLPAALQNSDYLIGEDLPNSAGAYSPQMGIYPLTTPMLLDDQALQFLYGANPSGLTPGWVQTSYGRSYQFTDNAAPQCIWVGSAVGGVTSLDFSACSGPTIINLNPGTFSSTVASAPANWVTDNAYLTNQAGNPTQNISIAFGTMIQEAIGNNAGDLFYANSGSDTLIGGTGNDRFFVGSGPVTIYGGGGSDIVSFSDPRADYTLLPNGHGGLTVTEIAGPESNGVATLYDIAHLQFADQTITTALPQVTNQTTSQSWTSHQSLSFTLPANCFTDPQGEALTLAATLADGSALPAWLSFNGSSFNGTVPVGVAGLSLAITATDTAGLAMTEYFSVTVNSSLVTELPAAATVAAGQANALAGIKVMDSNSLSASETVTVTLSDQAGILAAQTVIGGHVSGSGTQNLIISGSLSQVNADLATVTYSGPATLSATSDTITVVSTNSLGDSNSQQIAITNSAENYLTGAIVAQGAYGTILNGPGTWTIVGNSSLSGSGATASLVPANGASLVNQGNLTLGNGSLAGFIGSFNGSQIVHGSLVNAAGASLTLNNGGISVDSFSNAGTLNLVLNQAIFTNYYGQPTGTLSIDSNFINSGVIEVSCSNNVGGVVLFDGGGLSSADAFVLGSATVADAALVGVEFGGAVPFTLTGGTYSLYSPISVNRGATLDITGNTTFTHNFTNAGTINVLSGTLTCDYDLWGSPTSGVVNISPGAAVDIVSSVLGTANSGGDTLLKFDGPNATVRLGTPSTFNGTLSSFAQGDSIDLTNTQASSAAVIGNNLVISNGGSVVASIPVSGVANGIQITTASDGSGGSLILFGESVATALDTASSSAPLVDSSANVAANLNSLQTLALTGKLSSISLTDGGIPTLSITSAQANADASALKDIAGNFSVTQSVTGSNQTISGVANAMGNMVAFSGNANQYTITPSGDGVSLTVGTDHLSNIQALQFNDVTLIVAQVPGATTVTSGNVTELYGAVFGRLPDIAGLAYYENQLLANPTLPLTGFAQSFLASSEYTGNSAHNYAQTPAGDTQFITDAYNNLLKRPPGNGDAAWYVANVIAPFLVGQTPGTAAYAAAETLAHAYVITDFSASAEFLNDVTVTATNPASTSHWLLLI